MAKPTPSVAAWSRAVALATSALLLSLAWGCDSPTEPSEEQRLLTESRDRFRLAVGASYRYDYRNVCFCGPDTTREVEVVVRQGSRVSVTSLGDDVPIPPERWEEFLTVEEVFDEIQRALDGGAVTVRVSYDPALGYPRDVFIDFDQRIADEERGFTLANLTPM